MSLVNHRLPKNVIPINYKLYMEPNLTEFTFNGFVQIYINIKEATDRIILNSKKLFINTVIFDNMNVLFEEDNDKEIIIIKIDKNYGLHNISIYFSGILNDQMEGFYRSKYKVNNEIKYMATTQFEPTNARHAFPCFDEPNFKATFDITINGPSDKTILSNTSVKRIEETKYGRKNVIFNTTPIMSTYLVAFIIADLEYLEKNTFNNIAVRVYATPNNKSKLDFALDIAVNALELFIRWFEINYPLPKCDLVAIPDFSAGAMENWGLITFRENQMLCDEQTNLNEKQDIVNTICHEIAHQWFGNLVTMEWWTFLWLNESMATYFAWMMTDILFPEWHIWNQFIGEEYNLALELDSLETSHPIEVPIEKASDIPQIFDAISYSKGSCLIRFLVNYIGIDDFRRGMQKYLNDNKYGNTVSDDLWNVFGNNVRKLMESWTKQTGYPLISVNNESHLILSQTRFYKYGPIKESDQDRSIWIIPVEIRLEDSNILLLLDKETKIYNLGKNEDILLNPKRIGFYRTKYVTLPKMVNLLFEEKINLIDDGFNLSLSGYQDFSKPFEIINRLNLYTETNYYVWNSIITNLNLIYRYLRYHENVRKQYRNQTMLPIIKPLESIIKKLSWNDKKGESINDYKLRELAIEELAFIKNKMIINEALNRFRNNNWLSRKSVILPIVGKHGIIDDYKKLLYIYETNTNPQIIDSLLLAFGSVQNPELIKLSLDLVLSDKIREQDLWHYIRYLSYNEKTSDLIWDLVTSNWDKFIKKYPPGSSSITYFVKAIAAGFITENQLKKYQAFFKANPIEGANMAVNQTIEKIFNRILIIKRIISDPFFKK